MRTLRKNTYKVCKYLRKTGHYLACIGRVKAPSYEEAVTAFMVECKKKNYHFHPIIGLDGRTLYSKDYIFVFVLEDKVLKGM